VGLADRVNQLRRVRRAGVLAGRRDGDSDDVEAVWAELERQGTADLAAEGVDAARIDLVRGADLRYEGEGYEVSVMLDGDALSVVLDGAGGRDLAAAVAAFHAEHERLYGFSYPGRQNVELVNLRVQAVGHTRRSSALPLLPADRAPAPAVSTRKVYWRTHGWLDCDIYDRAALAAHQQLAGPCVVEEYGATVVVPPGWAGTVDLYGNLILARSDAK
jgi:N-methylhydantoinase A